MLGLLVRFHYQTINVIIVLIVMPLALTSRFSTDMLSSTAVRAMWSEVVSPYLDHYTVYYFSIPVQSGNEQMAIFPAGSSSGVIEGLNEGQEYLFSLTVTFNINGQLFEGESTEPAPLG